jgi:hypothetical protein
MICHKVYELLTSILSCVIRNSDYSSSRVQVRIISTPNSLAFFLAIKPGTDLQSTVYSLSRPVYIKKLEITIVSEVYKYRLIKISFEWLYRPLPHYIFLLSQSKCAEVNITALHFIGKAYGESKLATLLTEIANFEVRVNIYRNAAENLMLMDKNPVGNSLH